MKVTISGVEHPYCFGWLVFETISAEVGHNSPDNTAGDLSTLVGQLSFSRIVAFEAIKAGYKKEGKECPFKTSEDLAEALTKFTEIAPIISDYTTELLSFYNVEGEANTSKKKVKH